MRGGAHYRHSSNPQSLSNLSNLRLADNSQSTQSTDSRNDSLHGLRLASNSRHTEPLGEVSLQNTKDTSVASLPQYDEVFSNGLPRVASNARNDSALHGLRLADNTNPNNANALYPANSADSNAPQNATSPNSDESQSAEKTQSVKLGTIITTATGFATALIEEQRNIVVVEKEQIQNKGYSTLEDALQNTQATFTYNGFNAPNIDIRGQGGTASRAVKVLRNGIPINLSDSPYAYSSTPINALDINNIERVEIIPGGGAVLYGNGTRGGVVNIITKKSPQKSFFNAMLGSSFNGLSGLNGVSPQASVQGGGKIGNKVFASLSANYFDKHGYRVGEWMRGYSLSSDIIYNINKNHALTLDANFYQNWARMASGLTAEELAANRRQWKDGNTNLNKTNASVSLNYNFTNDEKNLIIDTTAFYTYDNNDIEGSSGAFFDNKAGLNLRSKYKYALGEVISGYEFLYAEGERGIYQTQNLPVMRINVENINNPMKFSNSLFILNRNNWTKWFNTTLGARYENAIYKLKRKSFTTTTRTPAATGVSTTTITGGQQVQDTTSNNFAIEVLPNFNYSDTGNIYLKYERGFLSPSASELTNASGATTNRTYYFSGVKPETYDTAEIGLKDEIAGQFFSIAAFYTHTHNEIMYESTGSVSGGGWRYYNLDSTQRAGVEITGEENIIDRFHFNQSLSYIYSNILKGENKGREVPLVPIYKLVFGFSADALKTQNHKLNIFVNTIFYGSKKDSSYNTMKPYNLTDLGLVYGFKGLSLSAGVRNIFNTKYNIHQYASGTSTRYLPGAGRTYYLELRYAL